MGERWGMGDVGTTRESSIQREEARSPFERNCLFPFFSAASALFPLQQELKNPLFAFLLARYQSAMSIVHIWGPLPFVGWIDDRRNRRLIKGILNGGPFSLFLFFLKSGKLPDIGYISEESPDEESGETDGDNGACYGGNRQRQIKRLRANFFCRGVNECCAV